MYILLKLLFLNIKINYYYNGATDGCGNELKTFVYHNN